MKSTVFDEPPDAPPGDPGGHPLLALPNCLVVPHVGTSTVECRHDMAKHAAARIVEHFHKSEASGAQRSKS